MHGGFLTWAAKPSVRKSPNPEESALNHAAGFTSVPAAYTHYYGAAPRKVPRFGFRVSDNFRLHMYGRGTRVSGSKKRSAKSSQERGTAVACFVLQDPGIYRDAEVAEDQAADQA